MLQKTSNEFKPQFHLKNNFFVKYINSLRFLRKKMYFGTSGLGVVSNDIETYVHIFNSYCYFESDKNSYLYKVVINCEGKMTELKFSMKGFESKIIKLNDYVEVEGDQKKLVSCRLYHKLPNKDFIPYFFSTFVKKDKATSPIHSSSFGNSVFREDTSFKVSYLFDVNLLSRSELCLLTLYPFKQSSNNSYKFKIIEATARKEVSSFIEHFNGESCLIDLKKHTCSLDKEKNYWLEFSGPSHANPYLLIDSQVLLHV